MALDPDQKIISADDHMDLYVLPRDFENLKELQKVWSTLLTIIIGSSPNSGALRLCVWANMALTIGDMVCPMSSTTTFFSKSSRPLSTNQPTNERTNERTKPVSVAGRF